ncbi:hypothetical protein MNBD_GAMMA12-2597 [hydrothermal vent metagenome]|uniref:Transposase IS66 central domain-containing protein n=1 Tax=hydrothermal vent metagenome TaxID=652676 RepID=A0A3B0Y7V2_9ZZZZ
MLSLGYSLVRFDQQQLMASVDKTSVRNEVSRVKADFQKLCDNGNVSDEVKMLMSNMFMIIELMLSIFLEKITKKDHKNSSLSSSQTGKDDTALSQQGSQGKGKKENGFRASNTKTTEKVKRVKVLSCDICGEALNDIPCLHTERRTKIDIIFEKVVEHIDVEVKQCCHCEATVKGRFPSDMPGPLQYGNGLKATVINLMMSHMVAMNRVQKLIKSMIGITLSEASLLKFVLRLHQALATWEHNMTEKILNMKAIHVDETSLRVDQKNHWIHVYSAEEITLKILHRRRGKMAINEIDIIPRYGGIIIHDCWASYLTYPNCGHGLCGSHLLRELTFMVDSNHYRWATKIKLLLQEACRTVAKRASKKLTASEYAGLQ